MKKIISFFVVGFAIGFFICNRFCFYEPKENIEILPFAFGSVMPFDLPNPFSDSIDLKNRIMLDIRVRHSLSLDTNKLCNSERCHSIRIEKDKNDLIVKKYMKQSNCLTEDTFSLLVKEISNYQYEYSTIEAMDGFETFLTLYDYSHGKMIYIKFPPISDDVPNALKITTLVNQIFESCKDTL